MVLKKILFLVLLFSILIYSAEPKLEIKTPVDPRCDKSISRGLAEEVSNLGYCTAYEAGQFVLNGLISTITECYKLIITLMAATPDPKWFCNQYMGIIDLVYSLLGLSIAFLVIYMALYSQNPTSRAKANHWLENIFYMCLYLAISYIAFSWILDINSQITTQFLSNANESFDVSLSISSLVFAIILAVFFAGAILLTFLTLILRYLLIPILLLFFPIGIFLYHTPPLKNWGALIMRATGITVFMTSVDSLIIFITSSVVSNGLDPIFIQPLLKGLGLIFGIGIIGYVNLFLFKTILLSVGLGGLEDKIKTVGIGAMYSVI